MDSNSKANFVSKNNKVPSSYEEQQFQLNLHRHPEIPSRTRIIIFLVGYVGFNYLIAPLMAFILQLIAVNSSNGMSAIKYSSYLNTFSYILVFLWILYLIRPYLGHLWAQLKSSQTWLRGLGYGLLVVAASAAYGMLANYLRPVTTDNVNQASVVSVITDSPILSFIWIPFLGPIVEEFAYRTGWFGALKSESRSVAYVASAILFGLIHFNLPTAEGYNLIREILIFGEAHSTLVQSFINELVNLPSYIISGMIFAVAYDHDGIAVPIIGHSFNNLLSFISILILS